MKWAALPALGAVLLMFGSARRRTDIDGTRLARADRQAILDAFEPYTRRGSAAEALLIAGGAAAIFVPGLLEGALIAEAGTAAEASLSSIWNPGWAERGTQISRAFGQTLADNFPVIDSFANGVATSIKSIDLTAKTYQSVARLTARLEKYVKQLSKFNGAKLGKDIVESRPDTSEGAKNSRSKG